VAKHYNASIALDCTRHPQTTKIKNHTYTLFVTRCFFLFTKEHPSTVAGVPTQAQGCCSARRYCPVGGEGRGISALCARVELLIMVETLEVSRHKLITLALLYYVHAGNCFGAPHRVPDATRVVPRPAASFAGNQGVHPLIPLCAPPQLSTQTHTHTRTHIIYEAHACPPLTRALLFASTHIPAPAMSPFPVAQPAVSASNTATARTAPSCYKQRPSAPLPQLALTRRYLQQRRDGHKQPTADVWTRDHGCWHGCGHGTSSRPIDGWERCI